MSVRVLVIGTTLKQQIKEFIGIFSKSISNEIGTFVMDTLFLSLPHPLTKYFYTQPIKPSQLFFKD